MVIYKFCMKCGNEILSENSSLCDDCNLNHNFSIFLKNFLDSLDGRLFFNDADFIRIGINEYDINEYIWKLNELNLIIFNNGRFIIKLDEINRFIEENYVKSLSTDSVNVSNNPKVIDVYNPETFVLNKERRNYKSDILNLVKNIKFVEENPKIPFPQSDDLNRFIFLGNHLLEGDMSKEEIKEINQVHERIVNMYTSTGLYFGVFDKYRKDGKVFYKLSDKGKTIFESEEYARNLGICHCILEHKIFYRIFMECFLKKRITKNNIVEVMLQYDLNLDSMVTIERRASCVSSWMHWIFRLMGFDF